jgi:hypothetical protein
VSGPIFERVVDRALGLPGVVVAGAGGACAPRERLRAQALQARDCLVEVAAAEYDHYLRTRAAAADRDGPAAGDDRTRSRLLSVLAVLVPSLGVAATGVFLLCGFGLRAFAVRPHLDDGLAMAGVIAAAVTAGAALGDLAWLLAARARRRRGHDPADDDPEVRRARDAWEHAVMERALVPFLLECADPERARGTTQQSCGFAYGETPESFPDSYPVRGSRYPYEM